MKSVIFAVIATLFVIVQVSAYSVIFKEFFSLIINFVNLIF